MSPRLWIVLMLVVLMGGWLALSPAQSQTLDSCDSPRPQADYRACDFFGKNFDGADFSGSDFTAVNMMNFKCRGCVFDGAILHKADMKWSDFSESSFVKTNLREADLFHTRFDYSILTGADLTDSFQFGTDLNFVQADRSIFARAFMKDIIMEEASFRHSDFSDVNMLGGYIYGSDFSDSNMQNMEMTAASAEEVKFSGSDLSGTVLRGARLIKTEFIGANLQGVEFGNAIFENTNFKDARNVPPGVRAKFNKNAMIK